MRGDALTVQNGVTLVRLVRGVVAADGRLLDRPAC